MKKIAVIIQTPTYGGPHNQVFRLYEPLKQNGWETILIMTNEAGRGIDKFDDLGISIYQLSLHRLRKKLNPIYHIKYMYHFIAEVKNIKNILLDNKIDIVQICGLMNFQAAFAAHSLNIPIVWQLLSNFAPKPLRIIFTPIVQFFANSVMTTGHEIARQHPGILSKSEKLFEFFPPVDTIEFTNSVQKKIYARKLLGIEENSFVIGTLGNQCNQKGHDYFIQIARKLKKINTDFKFVILGTRVITEVKHYNRSVIQIAQKYKLFEKNYLKIIEPTNRVSDLIAAFDVFVLTSRAEGVPTALLEAMSMGLIVVANDVGAISEIISNNENGFLISKIDISEYAQIIQNIYENSNKFMRDNAVLTAQKKFSIEACVKTHIQAYNYAISNNHEKS